MISGFAAAGMQLTENIFRRVKSPTFYICIFGTTEVVPFQNSFLLRSKSSPAAYMPSRATRTARPSRL
jgi:hypothetical protein